ncbi:hypothetical protein DW989_04620 [Bacteroides stercoris]|nr:hypothetical protein DW989_04620 [Bacteroides stercoris]
MKARIKQTGEIGDVLCWDDVGKTKLSILLKGNVCTIPYQNIEIIQLESNIDWEQRRYELAKAAMQGILSDEEEVGYACSEATYKDEVPKAVARFAVAYADALINELKGE